ncbi:MAG: isoamylase early set domain-containing protein [Planctomycetota bacterium]|nr:isoamylase early set domain-containing protein [Planctomycetota bacterium]
MPIARLLPVAILCERSRETTRERTPARSESHEPPRISTFGVKLTSRGMIFTQPASSGRKISVAGDFNGWSPGVTMLKLREDSGVFQALVDMPPGKYQYRIVIDGKWQADRYNEEMQLNAYGEPNSVIVVPES